MSNIPRHSKRTVTRRQVLKWATGLAGATALAAGGSPRPSVAGPTKTLAIGLSDVLYGLNDSWLPHRTGTITGSPQSSVYDHLLLTDPKDDFKVAPGLAESWTEKDSKEFTFKIRKGIPWQQGYGEVTADDVLFSLRLLGRADSKAMDGPYWRARAERIKAVNPSTLVMSFTTLEPELLLMLSTHSHVPIVCKKYVEAVGLDKADAQPVGSGPYQLAKLVAASELELTSAAPTHWRGSPKWAGIRALKIPSDATRMALLDTGRADLVNIALEQIQEARGKGYRVFASQTMSAYSFIFGGMFNKGHKLYTGKEPWHDIRVREAMNLAIDREAINKTFFAGLGVIDNVPGAAVAPPATTSAVVKLPCDLARAKALVKEAGKEGAEFDLMSYPIPTIPNQNIVQVVAAAWESIGLRPKIKPMDFDAWRSQWVKNQTPGAVFGWGMTMRPQFQSRFEKFFYSKSEGFGIYYDEKMDAMYEAIRTTPDATQRDKMSADAVAYQLRQWAAVPVLSCPYAIFAANPKTVGNWSGWWQTWAGFDNVEPV